MAPNSWHLLGKMLDRAFVNLTMSTLFVGVNASQCNCVTHRDELPRPQHWQCWSPHFLWYRRRSLQPFPSWRIDGRSTAHLFLSMAESMIAVWTETFFK